MKNTLAILLIAITTSFSCSHNKSFYVVCRKTGNESCIVNFSWKERDSLFVGSTMNIRCNCEDIKYKMIKSIKPVDLTNYHKFPYYKYLYRNNKAYLIYKNNINIKIYDSLEFVKKTPVYRIDSLDNNIYVKPNVIVYKTEPWLVKFIQNESIYLYKVQSRNMSIKDALNTDFTTISFDTLNTSYFGFNGNYGFIPFNNPEEFNKYKFIELHR